MRITVWAKVVAALAAGTGLAFLLPASSAVSQASPPTAAIRLVGTATLADLGAVIFVPVRYTCPAGDFVFFSTVTVTEAVGNNIVQITGGLSITCTGSRHRATATLVATSHPFRKGPAYGQAVLSVCVPPNNVQCQFATDARSILIT